MRKYLRVVLKDGSSLDLEIKSYNSLPATFKRTFSFNEDSKNPGKFHLCISESLIEDFSQVDRIEVIR